MSKRTMEWAFEIGKANGTDALGLNTQFQLALSRMTPFIHDAYNLAILIHQHQPRCEELVRQIAHLITEHSGVRQRCSSLTRALTDALNRSDNLRIVQVTSDFERECNGIVDRETLADEIGLQAYALTKLAKPEEALSSANRCLRLWPLAGCHLAKGEALILVGRTHEAEKSLADAKRLAAAEISRATSNLKQAAVDSDREWWKLRRERYRALGGAVDAALGSLNARPRGATTKEQISSGH